LVLDKQEKIYGEIQEQLTGGTSDIKQVVSQEDLDNAKDELVKKIKPKINDKLQKKVDKQFQLSDSLIKYEVVQVTKEIEVDSQTKNFDLTVKLNAKALVYNNKELRKKLRSKILEKLSPGQTIAETEFGDLQIEVEKFDPDLSLANLKIKATFPVAKKINLNEIKQNILNKSEQEARRYI